MGLGPGHRAAGSTHHVFIVCMDVPIRFVRPPRFYHPSTLTLVTFDITQTYTPVPPMAPRLYRFLDDIIASATPTSPCLTTTCPHWWILM